MVQDEKPAPSASIRRDSTAPTSPPDVAETVNRLLELVPTIPKNGQQRLSMVDLLQHVIDYIWDLQAVLSSPTSSPDPRVEHLNETGSEDVWEKL